MTHEIIRQIPGRRYAGDDQCEARPCLPETDSNVCRCMAWAGCNGALRWLQCEGNLKKYS